MSLTFDEYGRPFIIFKEQAKKERLRGLEAQRQNIRWARSIANVLRTSLGPRGMDKILVSSDNETTVTNDGATILDRMDVDNEIASLVVQLSRSMDVEIGDGTTGVVVLAGALLEQAELLLDKGLHSSRISNGYEQACHAACQELEKISDSIELDKALQQTTRSSLNSKLVNKYRDHIAAICVEAVLAVADLPRKDVNLDLIKIVGKEGGSLQESTLVRGIVLDKEISHPQMEKKIENARIVILTCPFEPPKPKIKHSILIEGTREYRELHQIEQDYFRKEVELCKQAGATLAVCQWGFDDEANYLLYHNQLPAIRWVGGVEIELLAIATKARIVARFEEITPEKLGHAGSVREVTFGTSKERMIFVEDCVNSRTVTIFLRAGSSMALEEAKRSVHDALCVSRNLIRENRIVYGGGSAEVACSLAVQKFSDTIIGVEQDCVRAFAEALDEIPIALAENSGLHPMKTLTTVKSDQQRFQNPYLGVDCLNKGTKDMRIQNVFETLQGKITQFRLATQVVRMILKIDDVITTNV